MNDAIRRGGGCWKCRNAYSSYQAGASVGQEGAGEAAPRRGRGRRSLLEEGTAVAKAVGRNTYQRSHW